MSSQVGNLSLLADLLKDLLEVPEDHHLHLHLTGESLQGRSKEGFPLRQEAAHLRFVSQDGAKLDR